MESEVLAVIHMMHSTPDTVKIMSISVFLSKELLEDNFHDKIRSTSHNSYILVYTPNCERVGIINYVTIGIWFTSSAILETDSSSRTRAVVSTIVLELSIASRTLHGRALHINPDPSHQEENVFPIRVEQAGKHECMTVNPPGLAHKLPVHFIIVNKEHNLVVDEGC